MGVVYRATDPALGRSVAIKVLPNDGAEDRERLVRFEREARILAALSHPNIAAIHSLEQHDDGAHLLVLELVEGESLSDRLSRGAIPLAEATRLATEVARAIETAHGRGVIHRDLKPDNIRITPDGTVKVLDFGLAAIEEAREDTPTNPSADETRAIPMAGDRGLILGTPGYLSPEQARAQTVDRRSDIFSFGCLLFECLSGQRAFTGDTLIDRLSAVLTREPDYALLPAEVPESIRATLRRCLEKDRELRLPSMRDVRLALEGSDAPARVESPQVPGAAQAPNNLPFALTSFVGRKRELEEVRALLGGTRLLAMTGVGGCGKTRLSLELARLLLSEMPGGIWWVELAAVADPSAVVGAVAAALGIRDAAGQSTLEALRGHLGQKAALLLLDNCEHLLEASGQLVHELLRSCAPLKVVVTSREPLGIEGENIWRLPSLEAPTLRGDETPEEIGRFEAVELFVERARAVAPSFALQASNAAAVANICRRLDGIPLAIELAAARVRVLSPEQIEAKLNDRFRLLTSGGRGALERHQTLRAAIGWSYALLNAEEKRCLRALSAFTDGWTLDAAAFVLEREDDEYEVLDLLSHLIDKSLVVIDEGDEPRYHLLESVRQYAAEEAEREGEATHDRDLHAEWYSRYADRAGLELMGAQQVIWLKRIDADHENLLAASRWFAQLPENADRGLALVSRLWWHWHQRGILARGVAIVEEAMARPGVDPEGRARAAALVGLGTLYQGRGDLRAAAASLEEGSRLARQLGDRRLILHSLHGLARIVGQTGDYARAESIYSECEPLLRENEDPQAQISFWNGRGTLAWHLGDQRRAQECFEKGLVVARRVANLNVIAVLNANLGAMDLQLGDLARAEARLQEALALQRSIGNRFGEAQALCNLGAIAYARMDDVASERAYTQSLDLCRRMGTEDGAANVIYGLAELEVARGNGDAAIPHLEKSIAHFEAQGDRLNVAGALGMLARAEVRRGNREAASRHLRRSFELHFELTSDPGIQGEVTALAELAAADGSVALAARVVAALIRRSQDSGVPLSPRAEAQHQAIVDACRQALGEEPTARAMAEGEAADWMETIEWARRWLGSIHAV